MIMDRYLVRLKIQKDGVFVERQIMVKTEDEVMQFIDEQSEEMLDLVNYKHRVDNNES